MSGGAQAPSSTPYLPGTDVTGAPGVLTPEVFPVPGNTTLHNHHIHGRTVRELVAFFDPTTYKKRSYLGPSPQARETTDRTAHKRTCVQTDAVS